jgi:hypothetical protein
MRKLTVIQVAHEWAIPISESLRKSNAAELVGTDAAFANARLVTLNL